MVAMITGGTRQRAERLMNNAHKKRIADSRKRKAILRKASKEMLWWRDPLLSDVSVSRDRTLT